MSKNSIRHNAIAWLSQWGTGSIVFVPLAQSSSFDVNYERVTHKGIGSRGPVGYYRYKDDNVNFNMSVLASNERTFGTVLTRNNFVTENYISGEIAGYNLSGCYSSLFELSTPSAAMSGLSFYSLYDDRGDFDLAKTGSYSGFFARFEDCLMDSWSFGAQVGKLVSVDASYSAQDVYFQRTGLSYISGVNGNYEAVRPSDVIVTIGSGTGVAFNVSQFNIESLQIELPIQYKTVEAFGSSKPSARKVMLPLLGSVTLEGLPPAFNAFATSALESPESEFDITVLVRSKNLAATGEGDYCAFRFPKVCLQSQSFNASVGDRMNGSMGFSFFECGQQYSTGAHGMFILRKVPDSVTYFAV